MYTNVNEKTAYNITKCARISFYHSCYKLSITSIAMWIWMQFIHTFLDIEIIMTVLLNFKCSKHDFYTFIIHILMLF